MLTGLNLLTTEFVLIFAILLSLGVAAFAGHYPKSRLFPISFLVPIISIAILFQLLSSGGGLVFDKELLVIDAMTQFAKTLISIILIGAVLTSSIRIFREDRRYNPYKIEFFVILLFAALGMMFMVSANGLISFYMGLEMQSLALYVLIAYRRADSHATEAALKYLILGAVGSGLFLYGTSLLYGVTGDISYEHLHRFAFMSGESLIYLIGLTLILTALFFKLSAVPFHMWTPDVYQGSPIFVTSFVATAPKVATIFGLLRMVSYAFSPVSSNFQSILIVVSILSLVIGAIMAIRQHSLLRVIAYSTITHMGYILLGIAAGHSIPNLAVIEYVFVYTLTSFALFTLVGSLRLNGKSIDKMSDFSGLFKLYPKVAVVLTVLIFSLAGIPPLAGFFIKFSILKSVIESNLLWCAVVAVIASGISAFYYLRIIKLVYFDNPLNTVNHTTLSVEKTHFIIASMLAFFIAIYVFYPSISSDIFAYFIHQYGINI